MMSAFLFLMGWAETGKLIFRNFHSKTSVNIVIKGKGSVPDHLLNKKRNALRRRSRLSHRCSIDFLEPFVNEINGVFLKKRYVVRGDVGSGIFLLKCH